MAFVAPIFFLLILGMFEFARLMMVQQALTNREVAGLETAFVVAGQSFAYTSSSLIKQITAMGRNLDSLGTMCPPMVVEKLRAKRDEKPPILQQMLETD